jgi:hypothetical protein
MVINARNNTGKYELAGNNSQVDNFGPDNL